jgi:hypothetical protein
MTIAITAIGANRVVPADIAEGRAAEIDARQVHIAQIGTGQVGAWSQQIAVAQVPAWW